MIDEGGKNRGVMETQEALKMALGKELDLVEISSNTNPPIAKIMDFGQFLYEQKKKDQKTKAKSKKSETKGIRLSFRISEHDEDIRVKQANKFLEQGNKIKVDMKLIGRERRHTGLAREKIQGFVDKLGENAMMEQPVNQQGGRLSVVVRRK
ncbi:translation initiation factor IF-3 [Candidatus Falkowbacteria bacterium]|nr:translation initiation factor IF-3 [Candidatus Falkowbacteria bacterium]